MLSFLPICLRFVVLVVMLFLITLLCGGCNGPGLSSGQKYSLAVDTYHGTATTMVALSRSGVIEKADYLAYEDNVRVPLSAMLDRWADAIAAKQPFTELAALNALLDEMVSARVVAERKARDAPKRSLAAPADRTRHVARAGRNQRHQNRHLRRARSQLCRAGPDPGQKGSGRHARGGRGRPSPRLIDDKA